MEKLEVHIQRGVVIGRVIEVKATNYPEPGFQEMKQRIGGAQTCNGMFSDRLSHNIARNRTFEPLVPPLRLLLPPFAASTNR